MRQVNPGGVEPKKKPRPEVSGKFFGAAAICDKVCQVRRLRSVTRVPDQRLGTSTAPRGA